jgi:hypothetical protein
LKIRKKIGIHFRVTDRKINVERSSVPVKPIAVTHQDFHPETWVTIEVELAERMLSELVRKSVRDNCSKTQSLRELLHRAAGPELRSGVQEF